MQCIECNAPCHSTSYLNEHHAQKNGNKSLCEKMLFCPYCKVIEQFLIWYENNKHKCFDFYEELLEYC